MSQPTNMWKGSLKTNANRALDIALLSRYAGLLFGADKMAVAGSVRIRENWHALNGVMLHGPKSAANVSL